MVNGIKACRIHSLINKKTAEGKWVESRTLLKYPVPGNIYPAVLKSSFWLFFADFISTEKMYSAIEKIALFSVSQMTSLSAGLNRKNSNATSCLPALALILQQ